MPPTSFGTAAAATQFFAALAVSTPTVSEIPRALEQQIRPAQKITSRSPIVVTDFQVPTIVANDDKYDGTSRLTTPHERLIGEIRGWSLLGADWDSEGATAPLAQSMKEAVSFVRLLEDIALPEPMLLASGHSALYWNEGDLYADIEFLGDGRIAFFIKNHGDKYKGVLAFDSQKMPAVFPTLFRA